MPTPTRLPEFGNLALPLSVDTDPECSDIIRDADGCEVAHVNPLTEFPVGSEPALARLLSAAPDLLLAAELAVATAWDPDENKNEAFERVAEEFRRDTGYLRPGKSEPAETWSEERDRERREAWNHWCTARARNTLAALRSAIAKARGTEVAGG